MKLRSVARAGLAHPSLALLTFLIWGFAAGTAQVIAQTQQGQASVAVKVKRQSVAILRNGQAVEIKVQVSCSSGSQQLESLVYVVQDGHTSQFSGIPVVCDGTRHEYVVRVNALDAPFHAGKATVSAYVVLNDTEATSAGDSETIVIRPSRRSRP